jgi:hypothetical protein
VADKDFLVKLTKQLMDDGKLIEAGFVGFRLAVYPNGMSKEQIQEVKAAFFAGALHLYNSMMCGLDAGKEETPDDLRRMELIHNELDKFGREYALKYTPTEGQA